MFTRPFTPGKSLKSVLLLTVFLTLLQRINAQQLKIKDFAVCGGSAPANVYNNKQGVIILGNTTITGTVGTNHLIDVRKDLTLKGNFIKSDYCFF